MLGLVLLTIPAFGFALVGGAGAPVMVMDDRCMVMLKPVPVTHLAAGGADAIAQRGTILADYAGIAPANVVVGGAAPGTLTIDLYEARLYGAGFIARYDDGVAGASWTLPPPVPGGAAPSYRWVQEINTNKPLGGAGGVYIDPRPNDDPGGLPLPYYWTDPEALGHSNGMKAGGTYDLRFRDFPNRHCANTHTSWTADLFLSSENLFTVPGADPMHVITIHDGVRWGFEIWPKKVGRRDLDFFDFVDSFLDVFWSPADWATNLMGFTHMGTTFPGGVNTTPGIPNQDQLPILDVWPPVTLPPDQIFFGANFMHPDTGQQATVQVEIVQLNLTSTTPIQVPVLFDLAGLAHNLEIKIDLSQDTIVVRAFAKVPPGDRQNELDLTLATADFTTFDPALHNLGVAGFRTFDLGLFFTEHPRGDLNGDLQVNGEDIQIFVDLLLDPVPDMNLVPFGDFTTDDAVTVDDIPDFVQALVGP